MKLKEHSKLYFFVDESGDPYFYNRDGEYVVGKEGCSKILIMGLMKTEEPESLRKAISILKEEIRSDEYLKDVPSFLRSLQSFHATDDIPEIRERVYKVIRGLNFKSEFIVFRRRLPNRKTEGHSEQEIRLWLQELWILMISTGSLWTFIMKMSMGVILFLFVIWKSKIASCGLIALSAIMLFGLQIDKKCEDGWSLRC